jgi:hypothetical protein
MKKFKLMIALVIGLILGYYLVISIFQGLFILGKPINMLETGIMLQNYVSKNNLSLPFPSSHDLEKSYLLTSQDIINNNVVNKTPREFNQNIKKEYIYNSSSYNCKYWSYVWTLYYRFNHEKYNLHINYFTTNNHVFVILYNESMYCTADENLLNCVHLS